MTKVITERINPPILVGGMNAHSGRLVVAAVDGRSGVAAVVSRQMAFMVNHPPYQRGNIGVDAFICGLHHKNYNMLLSLVYKYL